MSADRPISKDDVTVLLASALGQHKSEELVTRAAGALGLKHPSYNAADVRSIFGKLVKEDGLVGVVARFAVSRGDVDKLVARAEEAVAVALETGQLDLEGAPPSSMRRTFDLLHLISPALGVEMGREALEHAARRRGIAVSPSLSHAEALAVLDELTKVEGIVGVVARFAKARFLLDPHA